MNNSPQDGGQGPSVPNQPPEIYSTRKGAAKQDGTDFEIKMCALVFLRAVQSNSSFKNFKMRSNYEPAATFDDIVFSYGSPGNEQNILVQLKTSKAPIDSKKKFALQKYLKTLKEKKTSLYFKNCSYIFLTNADVNLNRRAGNVDGAAKKLLCTAWKPDNILQVGLTDDVCDEFRDDSGAEDFVNRLLIFRNQCGPEYLDELIKQELIKMCNGFVPECRDIQQTFVEKIKAWWGKDTKAALDENWVEWTQLKGKLLGQNILLKQIKFCEDTLSQLEKTVLGCASDIIVLKCDRAEAQIACSKVSQIFIRNDYIPVLFTDISELQSSQSLFSLWSEDVFEVLVITDVTNCCQNLGENIVKDKGNPEKQNKRKIVIVSSSDAKTLGLSQVYEFNTDFIKSTFKQLDIDSQQRLRNLAVTFQGKEIILGKIMTDNILEGGPLQDVLTSPEIQIGRALPERNRKYIPRTLSKRFVVNMDIFKSDDVFYIGGTDQFYLNWSVAKARGEELSGEILNSMQKHRFNAMTREELYEAISGFKCCAEILPEGPVHFLEVIDNQFFWIHSHGSTDVLFKSVELCSRKAEEEDCKKLIDAKSSLAKEDDLVKKEFQTVIVTDEPGSGKTSLLLEVAKTMKGLFPHRWIIHIDLSKHTVTLDQMKQSGNVTSENVFDLLSKAANPNDSELGKQLLKYSVLKSGNICIIFDAFDEISPPYTNTVRDILKLILSEFKLSTLWIASRHHMNKTLEEELKSKAFRIKPLSDEEQIDFMSMFWRKEKAKEFHTTIINKQKFHVTSLPLLLNMMCEIYPDLDMSDNFSRMSTPSDVVKLYEQFIEKKFDILFKDKCGLNSPFPVRDDMINVYRDHIMECHMKCSLYVIGLHDFADKSVQIDIINNAEKLCEKIEESVERLGIIDCVVDSIPHFIHRTFAEYFGGKWLAKYWKQNRTLLNIVSMDQSRFQFINKVLCLELDRELPAHLAVLNEDINALKELKGEGLNKTDVLRRTPLHLAVMKERGIALIVVSELLKYRPLLEIEDVLGYTPRMYAVMMGNQDVERILR